MTEVREFAGIRHIAERFDHFVIDQYGVLHDGTAPYPGAVEALAELKRAGKAVLLLSNSGRRSRPNEERLVRLGFAPGTWTHFLSSGEVAWRHLAAKIEARREPGRLRCLLVSREGDRSAVEGLPLDLVAKGGNAEIVLIAGSDGDRFDMDHYRRRLRAAAAAGVPCLCANPDKLMLTREGTHFGAGRIAETYAALGGPVTWIGKPHAEIYEVAMRMLGQPPAATVVCIGDSIEHDIAGGRSAGLSTVLVATGILDGTSLDEKEALFAAYGARPDVLLPSFAW